MSEAEKINFPEDFPEVVEYAKHKLETNGEFVRHWAKFGPPMLKQWAQMILVAAGEKCEG